MKILAILLLFFTYNGFAGSGYPLPAKPGIDNNQNYIFNKEPVKYLTAIYMDHHFANVTRGLKRVDIALSIIDPLYEQSPNSKFHPEKFKHAKMFEIKATLHLLKALLLQKKGFSINAQMSQEEKKQFSKVVKNKKKMGVLKKDELLAYAKIKGVREKEDNRKVSQLLKQSIDQMQMALHIDPQSPTIHYQYAKLLKDFYVQGESGEIEKHLYKAGELSLQEGDKEGFSKALSALREVNANSVYIKQLKVIKQ